MPYTITQNCVGCQACKKICPVTAITGEKKQIHVIDPDVCIECGACGRVCPHASVLDQHGKLSIMMKRTQWKRPNIDITQCMSCNMCIDACPVNCLDLSRPQDTRDTHGYPYLNDSKACIGCGFCASECPVDAIAMTSPAAEAMG
ncbi:MAG TPA: 4Fe-4S binding protein [Desulfomonilia bacterium]|nr:4Fe-4S binding protein [Desulfomonilia bacterium]